jgi:pilus assembly protein CpaF
MKVSLEDQGRIREAILKSIKIQVIEELINDREKLLDEISSHAEKVIGSINIHVSLQDKRELVESISDEIGGYGALRELIEDESVSDILVNGPEQIYVERAGKLELTNKRFINNDQLTEVAKRMVLKVGRRIDEAKPLVDARLADGSRLNVVIPPIALDGTSISIRKFGKGKKNFMDLVNYGSMSSDMANFLIIAARCRVNIIVSGGTGSGKTTLLNALSNYIADNERIITLEDAAELRLVQQHVLRLETRVAGIENTGQITMRDLVINSLRMRPDRIIVGECRGEETFEMLQAMNTGHDGSMSTLHANTPRDAVARLESMVMMSGMNMPIDVIRRNIASAVHIIIQASRMNDGSRKITSIAEVMGIEGDRVVLQDIFTYEAQAGRCEDGKIRGDFRNHGLLVRSVVMQNAVFFDLDKELKTIFGIS